MVFIIRLVLSTKFLKEYLLKFLSDKKSIGTENLT